MRSLFEISTRAMFGARSASEVASNNIANADTPGYSRQRAVMTEEVQKLSDGIFGRGISVSHVERIRNEMIDRQIIAKEHEIGDLSEKAYIYRLMESSMVSTSESGLDKTISDFFDAFSDLSSNPQDTNLRKILVSKSELMAATFRDLDRDLQELADLVREQANVNLNRVNELLQQIGSLNREVITTSAKDNSNNNVLDLQTQTLKELAELVEFDVVTLQDDSLEIRIDGVTVVSGQHVSALQAEVDEAGRAFRVRLQGGKLLEPGQGSLSANIHMFEEGIPEAQYQLDTIARSLIDAVDAIHNSGYGLVDGGQRNFFDATSTGASNMKVNGALVDNPMHIAASSVDGEAGNNDIALEIVNLQNDRFVEGQTISTKAIELMGLAGLRLNEIDQKLQSSSTSREFLMHQQEQFSGVSIDEELGNLIRFQNSYQAAAKVLDTGRQMFETLLSIA